MVRAHMHDLKIPGVSLAVIRNGTIIKAAGYGLANVELNSPVTPQSVFTTCSIAKQFVAVGVMMLVEQGKVALDDSVTKYLPNSPPAWKEITVRHLLTHTSGVPDYAFGPTPWVDLRHDYTEDEVVRILARQPLDFRPGERRSYSNSGYVILGALIHEVSGKRWDEFLQERIFRPLGMTSTRLMSEADIIPNDFLGIRCSRSSGKNTPLSVAILDPPAEFSSRAEAHCQLRKSCVFGIPSALGPRSISPAHRPVLKSARVEASRPFSVQVVITKDGWWRVPSQAETGIYRVQLAKKFATCECPDFTTRGVRCKHIFAATFVSRREKRRDDKKSSSESVRIGSGSDETRFKEDKMGVRCWSPSKSKRKSMLAHTKQLTLLLVFALAFQNSAFAFPASDDAQRSSQGSKVKTEIQRYDSTKKKQIKVTLRSGNEIKGFVSRSDDVSFDLTEKSGHVSTLSYGEVNKVHGAGLSRGAKIGIVVAGAVVVVAVVFAIGFKRAGY